MTTRFMPLCWASRKAVTARVTSSSPAIPVVCMSVATPMERHEVGGGTTNAALRITLGVGSGARLLVLF